MRWLNARLLRPASAAWPGDWGCAHPVLWGYVPQAEVLLDTLDPEIVIYHCVDDIASQAHIDAASFLAAEERFARRADLVIASAPALADRMRRLSSHVLLAPNVADTASFRRRAGAGSGRSRAVGSLTEPRIVFVGAIAAKKLDFDLLLGIARARRGWTFALIGPVGLGDPETDVSELAREPNIHLLGAREHRDLPTCCAPLRSGSFRIGGRV